MEEKRIENIEIKLEEIHKALIGDEYGNNGYMHRISRLEKAVKAINIRVYMAIGGMAVITFLANLIF